MIYTRQEHAQFLEDELRAQTRAFKQKLDTSATFLLQEREEIIRQLSMLNKTAGMGALVASLAHELNQPLTVIQTNTEMIDLVITNTAMDSNQTSSMADSSSKRNALE